ncbi:hypothetical protein DRP04_10785 [Archaeoglobales archaeon]|nr:MAG: hypothetical protein DRP04_10785 [Archaeoglobales archaeon]
MRYIGRTKVGRMKPNPKTELAIIRLPVELKGYAGQYCHIWEFDKDLFLLKFGNAEDAELPNSIHLSIQHKDSDRELEERVKRLEAAVEELTRILQCNNQGDFKLNKSKSGAAEI